ncbi:MAG: PQQ-binding-like beta-propeller repeat protein [Planctomycetales bacterium]|nr:PQQ-binding-like beta-propeller repeat protein [Planctomycetales bacterium]
MSRSSMRAGLILLAVALAHVIAPPKHDGGEWPQFRGLHGGLADDSALPTEWTREKNVRWQVQIPGYGWSSPIVWGDKVFVTTAIADKQRPPERKGPGGGDPVPPDAGYRWEVHCLDVATGRTLWQRVAAEHKPTLGNHISNTYASETPVTDGRQVYAYFGMAGLIACYDLSGGPMWQKELGAHRVFGSWGTSASPVLDGERLFVQCDNEERSFVVALDVRTGEELWRANRAEKSSWGTPVVWRNSVRNELVLMGAKRIRSYDPATGKVLWELATQQNSIARRPATGGGKPAAGGCKSTPVATPDLIFVGMAPRERNQSLGPMWAVKAGAFGDISLTAGETSNAHIAWSRTDAGPHFASAIVCNGLLFVFTPHGGQLRCFDAKTGSDVYQQRLPGAGDFKSSPWADDGRIFNLDENGTAFVVAAGREFKLLATNRLDELCWSSPAAGAGALFVRGVKHLYSIRR